MENNEAKQKAKELIDYFSSIIPIEASFNDTADEAIRKMRNDWIATKQCAIKVCNEKIATIVELSENQRGYWLDKIQEQIDIKKEIEKL